MSLLSYIEDEKPQILPENTPAENTLSQFEISGPLSEKRQMDLTMMTRYGAASSATSNGVPTETEQQKREKQFRDTLANLWLPAEVEAFLNQHQHVFDSIVEDILGTDDVAEQAKLREQLHKDLSEEMRKNPEFDKYTDEQLHDMIDEKFTQSLAQQLMNNNPELSAEDAREKAENMVQKMKEYAQNNPDFAAKVNQFKEDSVEAARKAEEEGGYSQNADEFDLNGQLAGILIDEQQILTQQNETLDAQFKTDIDALPEHLQPYAEKLRDNAINTYSYDPDAEQVDIDYSALSAEDRATLEALDEKFSDRAAEMELNRAEISELDLEIKDLQKSTSEVTQSTQADNPGSPTLERNFTREAQIEQAATLAQTLHGNISPGEIRDIAEYNDIPYEIMEQEVAKLEEQNYNGIKIVAPETAAPAPNMEAVAEVSTAPQPAAEQQISPPVAPGMMS
ncbi:MAG: hypothetical protein H6861_07235 [Rhodospirillales bacterium]|nr:hypothetical protein [Rhodospirillales bacterium]